MRREEDPGQVFEKNSTNLQSSREGQASCRVVRERSGRDVGGKPEECVVKYKRAWKPKGRECFKEKVAKNKKRPSKIAENILSFRCGNTDVISDMKELFWGNDLDKSQIGVG